MTLRFALAQEAGAIALPTDGPILFLRPAPDLDLGEIALDRAIVSHGFKPDHDSWIARGVSTSGAPQAAVVSINRARGLTLDMLAQAIEAVPPGAPIVVDGNKTDGIESILKVCRAAAPVGEVFSKAHGKCFAFPAPDSPPDGWKAEPAQADGYTTKAGVFSADGIDPGSALLADHLTDVSGRVCDLGAGWGYLSAQLCKLPKVTSIDLVEAEQAALDCARINVSDARATFHWADALRYTGGPFDVVVSNPPFHTGRKGEPSLGQGFIQTAARILRPKGRLLMVANRHLPYEATLDQVFASTMVLADQGGYKVIEARNPKSPKRRSA